MNINKLAFAGASICALGLAVSSSAQASWQTGVGWSEVIACPISSFTSLWGHSSSLWGSTSPGTIWKDSGTGWNTYAQTGDGAGDCDSWQNGTAVGGATYSSGSASVAQGVDVFINNWWYDFDIPSSWTDEGQCGHQHTSVYVWGWRYTGSSWSFEFVEANQTAAYWNTQTSRCELRAGGHPLFPPPELDAFAFGDKTITVSNSPYAVIYTKAQATSHFSAGCGEHGCFHRVLTMVHYN